MELSQEQEAALGRINTWYRNEAEYRVQGASIFRLFGAAGTGKTTLARHVPQALGVNVAYGAYTGKAASVLTRKGCPATTIHSAIYKPLNKWDTRKKYEAATRELDLLQQALFPDAEEKAQMALVAAEIQQLEQELRTPGFELNPDCEWAYADLIVLDEVSMVNAKMAADIESFGVPVLVLGDPHQLPPIGGEGYYTDATPDVLLEKVHRQALESPVLALATVVREGGDWKQQRVRVNLEEAMAADQVLVWKNATRWNLIQAIRQRLDRPPHVPVLGDRIMCTTNNKDMGILNGQQFEVLDTARGEPLGLTLHVRDEEGHEREVKAYAEGFRGLDGEAALKANAQPWRGSRGAFTFANAITVHKAQGSEWENVYVVDQTDGMISMNSRRVGPTEALKEARRWVYTAITRASKRVTISHTSA